MGVLGKALRSGGYVHIEDDAAEELLSSAEAQAFVAGVALVVRDKARELNPSAKEREFIYASHVRTAEGEPASAEVGYVSAIWHIIEFGSINNPPYRPLTAAAEAAGLTFEPGS